MVVTLISLYATYQSAAFAVKSTVNASDHRARGPRHAGRDRAPRHPEARTVCRPPSASL